VTRSHDTRKRSLASRQRLLRGLSKLRRMAARPTRVRRSSATDGGWEMAEAPPAPRLAGLVRGYTGFVERSMVPLRRREVPSPTAVMIVNFGAPLEVEAPGVRAESHPGSFLARVSELPATTEFTGTSAGVQVDFTAIGAHLFCGLAMSDLPAPSVGLEELLGEEGRLLTDELEDAPGWEARFDLLDAAIERRVAAAASRRPASSGPGVRSRRARGRSRSRDSPSGSGAAPGT